MEKSKDKKSKSEQSDLCDIEQVTLKPQLQVHHCLTTWLQLWYHSLLWRDSIQKGADLEKQNCLFGVHPAELGKLTSHSGPNVVNWNPYSEIQPRTTAPPPLSPQKYLQS